MYKLHLILKYLRKRRIAWVSLIAVMLCTAMVLVVISVMGGWLEMFRDQFHGLTGDVVVARRSLTGFPHYQEMIRRIEALPEVRGAVPVLKTYGLVNVNNQIREGVQVIGFPIERVGLVNRFPQSLYRQHNERLEAADNPDLPAERREELRRLAQPPPSFELPLPEQEYRDLLPEARKDPSELPGAIVGAGVIGIGKDEQGNVVRDPFMYRAWVNLMVLGLSDETTSFDVAGNKAEQRFWIVDDSRTKIWQYDNATVYVPFDVLQQMLGMHQQEEKVVENGQTLTETIPARTSEVQVGIKPGYDLAAARARIEQVVDEVVQQQGLYFGDPITVQTWEQTQAKFLAAVEKEKVLVTFLFSIISVVAIFLIFCIFYMIVVEKTKDIGIIKSVGATGTGVAGIFLGYGLAIGIVGGGLGLLVGYLIVSNINQLHDWMGAAMGIRVWDPEVYAFDTIPNTMDPQEVTVIVAIAIVASVLGAMVPALRAARMNPVEALRWE